MDNAKCKTLKAELASQPEPQIISVERFFDGSDDLGSIGCNLIEHPGVDAFRDVLTGLLRRPDVQSLTLGRIAGPLQTQFLWSVRFQPTSCAALSARWSPMRLRQRRISAFHHPSPRGIVHPF